MATKISYHSLEPKSCWLNSQIQQRSLIDSITRQKYESQRDMQSKKKKLEAEPRQTNWNEFVSNGWIFRFNDRERTSTGNHAARNSSDYVRLRATHVRSLTEARNACARAHLSLFLLSSSLSLPFSFLLSLTLVHGGLSDMALMVRLQIGEPLSIVHFGSQIIVRGRLRRSSILRAPRE